MIFFVLLFTASDSVGQTSAEFPINFLTMSKNKAYFAAHKGLRTNIYSTLNDKLILNEKIDYIITSASVSKNGFIAGTSSGLICYLDGNFKFEGTSRLNLGSEIKFLGQKFNSEYFAILNNGLLFLINPEINSKRKLADLGRIQMKEIKLSKNKSSFFIYGRNELKCYSENGSVNYEITPNADLASIFCFSEDESLIGAILSTEKGYEKKIRMYNALDGKFFSSCNITTDKTIVTIIPANTQEFGAFLKHKNKFYFEIFNKTDGAFKPIYSEEISSSDYSELIFPLSNDPFFGGFYVGPNKYVLLFSKPKLVFLK